MYHTTELLSEMRTDEWEEEGRKRGGGEVRGVASEGAGSHKWRGLGMYTFLMFL